MPSAQQGSTAAERWEPAPGRPALGPHEVHVWRVALNVPGTRLPALESALDTAERRRADRLRMPDARRRFVAARARLRHILARYLNAVPGALRFASGPNGKPVLAGDHAGALAFNVAHTGDVALYAVTLRASIGIDVERLRADVPIERIAARFFAPAENARLQAMPPQIRRACFFQLWACKEAFVKARGESVWRDCERFAAPPLEGWTLVTLELGPAYAGALVVAGGPCAIARWRWRL